MVKTSNSHVGNSLFTPDNLPKGKSLTDVKLKRPLAAECKRATSKVYCY